MRTVLCFLLPRLRETRPADLQASVTASSRCADGVMGGLPVCLWSGEVDLPAGRAVVVRAPGRVDAPFPLASQRSPLSGKRRSEGGDGLLQWHGGGRAVGGWHDRRTDVATLSLSLPWRPRPHAASPGLRGGRGEADLRPRGGGLRRGLAPL